MSVHALFRMARSLFPIDPQSAPAPPQTPPPPAPPELPAPPQRFRPSHSLYSSITSRHEQLQRARDGGALRGGSLSEKDSSPAPSQKAQGCAP